jgi:hypothetical protein
MRNKLTVAIQILCLSLACISQSLYSQSVRVLTPYVAPADIINAGAIFDVLGDKLKDLGPSAFSLTFVNITSPREDVMATMYIESYATLDEDHVAMLLYKVKTSRPFLIPKEGRVFTSLDTRGLEDMQFTSSGNDANVQRLKDKILDRASGGRIPSGTYKLIITLQVVQVGTRTLSAPEDVPVLPAVVVVSNPSNASLILPSENGYQYPTPFPQFQWTYDTRSAMLSVYEQRPGQTPESATQASDPYLQVRIDRQKTGNMPTYTFTYPQSASGAPGIDILQGPRPLEPGRTYVVVLEGEIAAFGTTVDPLRTIRSFTIDDPQSRAVIHSYGSIFSGPEYQRAIEMLQNGNLQIDENTVTLNNGTISLQELKVFLEQNRQRKISIHIEE